MGDNGFKHISVTAAEEDDFVIQAGVVKDDKPVEQAVEPSVETAPETPFENAFQLSDAPEPDLPVGEKPAAANGAEAAPARETAAASPAKPGQRRTAGKDGGYREPTLEDLDVGEMPLAQRIVIIAAIVCIIGAVIYYFVFMR